MKPSLMQSVVARNLPSKAYFTLAVLLGASLPFTVCPPELTMFRDWQFALLFSLSVVLMGALGVWMSLPPAVLFLGPIYYLQRKLNGAPFQVGDHVCILAGPQRGRLVKVYAVWGERNQVRVDLGEQGRAEVTDVYSLHQVCREKAA